MSHTKKRYRSEEISPPMKPPFFQLKRSRLNGIISPPYPEVNLDTFSFPVGGRLAAWRAVSWPRLPKVAILGSENAVFGPKPVSETSLKINCYNNDGTPKRQLWIYTLTCHNISKRFAAGCYFERASTNLVDFLDKLVEPAWLWESLWESWGTK